MRLALSLVVLSMAVVGARGAETTPLIEAVKEGVLTAVRAALAKGADVTATEPDGTTALHWAVHRDDANVVAELLRAGAQARAVNQYGVAPIILAAENGNAVITEQLLKAGADANTAAFGGETVLMTAARTGRPGVVKVLLAHGAKVDAREHTHGQTALMWAAVEGSAEVIRVLSEAGADLHARSRAPAPEVSGAVSYRAAPAADAAKGDGSRRGALTPLLFAAREGRLDAVRALLDAGANVHDAAVVLPGKGPYNALHLAIANAAYEVASYLLDRGADPNYDGPGWTPLHVLAVGRSQPYYARGSRGFVAGPQFKGRVSGLDLARKLVAKGADVNTQSWDVVFSGYPAGQGAVAGKADRTGATPFWLAATQVDFELMKVLAELGADSNIPTNDQATPLMAAVGIGNKNGSDGGYPEEAFEAAKLCMELGADVNAIGPRGWTALHASVMRGHIPLVNYLIEKGARLDAKTEPGSFINDPGLTPRGVAAGASIATIYYRRPDIVALLGEEMRRRGMVIRSDAEELEDGVVRSIPPAHKELEEREARTRELKEGK